MNSRGISLIEVIIYIALYGILMSGIVIAAASISATSARAQMRSSIAQEGAFIIAKIDWYAARGKTIDIITNSVPDLVSSHVVMDPFKGQQDADGTIEVSFTLGATSTDGYFVTQDFYTSTHHD